MKQLFLAFLAHLGLPVLPRCFACGKRKKPACVVTICLDNKGTAQSIRKTTCCDECYNKEMKI